MAAKKQPPKKQIAKDGPEQLNIEQAIFQIGALETVAREAAPYGVKPGEVRICALGFPVVYPASGNAKSAEDYWENELSIPCHQNQTQLQFPGKSASPVQAPEPPADRDQSRRRKPHGVIVV